jgi:phosphoenolpyruvate-protein phosphotransferase (PTS system enzyme I)
MIIKKGIPVSPGVAICHAAVLDAEDQPIARRTVPQSQVPQELVRLDEALVESRKEIEAQREKAHATLGPELAKIFSFHLGLTQDKALIGQFKKLIQNEKVTAEFAVFNVLQELVRKFQSLDSKYFQDRDADIWDLERRIVGHLLGKGRCDLSALKHDTALISHDLTPSQTAALDKTRVRGIVTEIGGPTSHTAILAHALGIPAVVGCEGITANVRAGDQIIVDGNRGIVIIDPDAAQLLEYRESIVRYSASVSSRDELNKLPAVTLDGMNINLTANIEFANEVETALKKGAQGIGLYRTEFLFLAAKVEPSEETQYKEYTEVLKGLKGKPLTIRTLDLGADKPFPGLTNVHEESNPFLGCRSIRMCLQNLPLFKTQLRAILRASVHGQVRIMFPMISNISEIRQAKMILGDVMEDLDDQGIRYREKIPVGIMIEVPSAAIQAKTLARECDFFSIGTNDLIQYTIAVDRGNERIASLYNSGHPAVIQLIKDVIRTGARYKIDVSLCGEMGGEPEFIPLLLGMGLKTFSVTPPAIPEAKRVIRGVTFAQCQKIARKVATLETDREVLNYLREELKRLVPEALDGRSINA